MNLLLIMTKCLILTIIIELVIAIILGVKYKKDMILVIIVNIITNPFVVSIPIFLYKLFGFKIEIISLIILEILTVLVEGIIYLKKLKYKSINPFILSLLLNLSSYMIGEFLKIL